MASEDNIFIKLIFDTINEQGVKSAERLIGKFAIAGEKSSEVLDKNGKKIKRHSYLIRTNKEEYDNTIKSISKFNKAAGKLKTVAPSGFQDVTLPENLSRIQSQIAAAKETIAANNKKILNAEKGILKIEDKKQSAVQKGSRDKVEQLNKSKQALALGIKERRYENKIASERVKSLQTEEKATIGKINFSNALRRNSYLAELKYNANLKKARQQEIRDNTILKNTWADIQSSMAAGKGISFSKLGTLTKALPPEVSERVSDTVRNVKKLYDTSDRLKRYTSSLHKLSMGFLAINMSALGLYFSMFSVIALLRSGLGSLFGPLSDIGNAFTQLAMSEAFGMGIGEDLDPGKVITAWERFIGLQADIQSMLLVLGTEILTDPAVWDAVSSSLKEVFAVMSQPETIKALKTLFISLSKALPAIARELPGIANFISAISPYLETLIPLAFKAAIAMPFLALATGVASFAGALMQGVGFLAKFYANYKALGALKSIAATTGVAQMVSALPIGVPTVIPITKVSAPLAITPYIKSISWGPLLLAFGKLLGALGLAVFVNDILKEIGIRDALDTWVNNLAEGLKKIPFVNILSEMLYIQYQLVTGILDTISLLLQGDLGGAFDRLMEMSEKISKYAQDVLKSYFEPIVDSLQWVYDKLSGLYDSIVSKIAELAKVGSSTASNLWNGALSLLGFRATGGYIGESGAYYLHKGEYVSPSSEVRSSTNDSPSVTNNSVSINIYGNMTREVNDDLINKLQNAITYGGGV